jgi:hypothetical protein
LKARESDIKYGMGLITDPRASSYWDPNEALGKAYSRILGIESGPAWDVYFLYGKGARWDGAEPPRPPFWMHQLAITNAPRLDPTIFRQHVEQMLAK